MRLAFIIFTLVILRGLCLGQYLVPSQQLTIEDGLPSNEIYDLQLDSLNRLWVATDRGLSVYNGYEFKNYSIKDGLKSNLVIRFHKDERGKIWFWDFDSNIYYLQRDSIIFFANFNLRSICDLHVLNDTLIYIGSINKYALKKDGEQFKLNTDKFISESFVTARAKIGDNIINYSITVDSKDKIFDLDIPNSTRSIDNYYNDSVFSFANQLYTIEEDSFKLLHTGRNTIRWFKKLSDNQYLLLKERKGLEIIEDGKTKEIYNNEKTGCLIETNNHGYFVGTLGDGILYFPSHKILTKHSSANISNMTMIKNDLFYLLKGSNEFRSIKKGLIWKADESFDGEPLLFEANNKVIGLVRKQYTTKTKAYNLINNEFVETRNRIFFVDTDNNIWHYGHNLQLNKGKENIMDQRISTVYQLDSANWLIGAEDGLYNLNTKNVSISKKFKFIDDLNVRITSINIFKEVLILGTLGNGVFIIKPDLSYRNIRENEGLSRDLVNDIYVDKSERAIWVSTTKGLSKISNILSKNIHIENYYKEHGLASNHINSTFIYQDTLRVATTNGLSYFSKKHQVILEKPILIMDKLEINSKPLSKSSLHNLSYQENNIRIDFTGSSLIKSNSITYKYRLLYEKSDSAWNYTNDRFVIYNSLKSGTYVFEIAALNFDKVSSPYKRVRFSINSPFWLTWWFVLTIFISLILSGTYITKYLIKQKEIKNRLVATELKSLRSQMNPHFTFNSLNSIQRFILVNNPDKAVDFIHKYSSLVRKVLNNSSKEFISLREEIEAIELYLSIEKERLQDKFEYKINTSEDIDVDFEKTPSMIFQPYIENSIWHGISHLEGNGEISVNINKINESIQCEIIDNGVGRLMSQKLKSKNNTKRKSYGMSLSADRLELLNKRLNKSNNIKVEVIDLYHQDNSPAGTKVVLHIHLNT